MRRQTETDAAWQDAVQNYRTLYGEDAGMVLRKSHKNQLIKEVYDTYLEKPGSEKAHHLLHTSYVDRSGRK